ncbi:MAG: peroxiredoxin [Gammaproteobacteria bacterium]|nr:peroxiredoxin [Gammaproteobacteria bacterium]
MTNEKCALDTLVPDFSIIATNDTDGKLSSYSEKNILLFFYPKDSTPICTSEAKAFRDYFEAFTDRNTVIFGVSRDNLTSHERFKEKLQLPFELISDSSEQLCNYFDVIAIKNFFGKKIHGIVRSTFLIDKQRLLRAAWRKIKVTGHIEEVLEEIDALKNR